MPKTRNKNVRMPLAERVRIAREINAYRAANPRQRLPEVLAHFPGVTESNYYAWQERMRIADAMRKANGEAQAQEVQHFPLAAIPEKRRPMAKPAMAKSAMAKSAMAQDDDKHLAATLLEVAARLLKR